MHTSLLKDSYIYLAPVQSVYKSITGNKPRLINIGNRHHKINIGNKY